MTNIPSPRRDRSMTLVLTIALLVGAMAAGSPGRVSAGQDATPGAGATVPAAPPWRAELIPRNRPLTVTVDGVAIPVEVANTDDERQLGLGERAGLLPGTGMLFVFEDAPQVRNFWMGGMQFCLDIVWVDAGAITGAAQNTCPGPPNAGQDLIPRHQSPGISEFVLEVPAGFLAENGLRVGSAVSFSQDPYSVPTPEPLDG